MKPYSLNSIGDTKLPSRKGRSAVDQLCTDSC